MSAQNANQAVAVAPEEATTLNLMVMLEDGEDGWIVVSCPALPGCISQGRTREEALANIKEAIEGYMETTLELGRPLPTSHEYEFVEVSVYAGASYRVVAQ